MEQELFTTMDIANALEYKTKNPRRDVAKIAEHLGLEPVETRRPIRNGKPAGGQPEKLWSREQKDAILADNRNRHKKNAQIDSPVEEPHEVPDTSPADEPDVTVNSAVVATGAPVVAEPVPEEISLAQRADRIRQLQADVQRGIIQIGNELIAAKEQVGYGNWSHWLETEFSWTQRTANNFMRVAERFGKMENVFQFQPSTLQAMLALPEGDEQKFIDSQAEAGNPVEKQSAREVQKSVKQFKQRHAVKKDSDNTEPVDDKPQDTRADMDAEEPPPDLSNRGETFSIFGRETDKVTEAIHDDRDIVSENTPAADTLPSPIDEPDEDTNAFITPAQVAAILKLIDETDDLHALKTIYDSLLALGQEIGKIVLLAEMKLSELANK